MIRVSVTSADVRNQSGISKASNKPYNLDFQTVWVHTVDRKGQPNPYPEKVEVIVEKDSGGLPMAYPVGQYTFAPGSIYVNRNGDLALQPKLIPIPAKG